MRKPARFDVVAPVERRHLGDRSGQGGDRGAGKSGLLVDMDKVGIARGLHDRILGMLDVDLGIGRVAIGRQRSANGGGDPEIVPAPHTRDIHTPQDAAVAEILGIERGRARSDVTHRAEGERMHGRGGAAAAHQFALGLVGDGLVEGQVAAALRDRLGQLLQRGGLAGPGKGDHHEVFALLHGLGPGLPDIALFVCQLHVVPPFPGDTIPAMRKMPSFSVKRKGNANNFMCIVLFFSHGHSML